MMILCIYCFCPLLYCMSTHIHITPGDGLPVFMVFWYLQINNGVAGLCNLYSTSCFIVIMAIVHTELQAGVVVQR